MAQVSIHRSGRIVFQLGYNKQINIEHWMFQKYQILLASPRVILVLVTPVDHGALAVMFMTWFSFCMANTTMKKDPPLTPIPSVPAIKDGLAIASVGKGRGDTWILAVGQENP